MTTQPITNEVEMEEEMTEEQTEEQTDNADDDVESVGVDDDYEGTEGSRWGKIVVGRSEGGNSVRLVDSGPYDRGFKSTGEAMNVIESLAMDDLQEHMEESPEDVDVPVSKYYVLRVVKTVEPKLVTKVDLDLGM